MIKNIIKNQFKSLKAIIFILLLITIILFTIISSYIIQNTLDDIDERSRNKFKVIEKLILLKTREVNQVIYGMATLLARESIEKNNQYITKTVSSFDNNPDRYKALPFSGFKVLDVDDIIIKHTLIPTHLFKPVKNEIDLALLKLSKETPFEAVFGPIRTSIWSKERIIPFCMAISNPKKVHTGTICSGLLVSEFNNQLNDTLLSAHTAKIKLLDQDSFDNESDNYKADNVLTISNILKHYFQGKNFTIRELLPSYPIAVELELSYVELSKRIGLCVLNSIGFFILFSGCAYYLILINRRLYQAPFYEIQKRIFELPNNFTEVMTKVKKNEMLESGDLCMHHLSQAINDMIDYCYLSYLDAEKNALQQPAITLRNSILHLVLTERHYCSSHKAANVNSGALYINQLKKLIKEQYSSVDLFEFLTEVSEYCSRYYHGIDIKVEVHKKDHKNFTFYHSALTETIFHIFAAITRIAKFDEDVEFVLSACFVRKSSFPTISIEATISVSSLMSSGWELGPSYVYSSLLSIYLLAKENNLFFHIEQKNQKVIFILEPVNNERLQHANSLSKI